MMLKDLFKKSPSANYISLSAAKIKEPNVPTGMWKKCNKCQAPLYTEDVRKNHYICPKCGGYFRMHAYRRIEMIADEGTFEEWDRGLISGNPLKYAGYEKKLEALREKTNLDEAVTTGVCRIGGFPAVLGVCDARFLMSSMGWAVGEKITRAVERASQEKLPVVLFCCSGGARMQEGIVSLMQMAKTSAALKRHSDAGLLTVTVLTDPTTGGVTASFAMLGDIILAEPEALIGFAGPRVIEQTIGQKLPEGFQRSEFLLKHGFLDAIVAREDMKDTLAHILSLHQSGKRLNLPEKWPRRIQGEEPEDGKEPGAAEKKSAPEAASPWERVQISRMASRPSGLDYIERLFTGFMELHGDRCYGDDGAVVGGIASFHGVPVTVIAQQKGKTTKDNIARNFGMPSPEGYRKALRLMKQAEKFGRPIVCFVDTPGAFCGLEAEERGQGSAIAENLFEMSGLKVPVLSVIIGEGGSGGALAMAVANEVWMLENSIYSILSPEGFASILWKDSKRAPEAARVMKITARDLKKLGIIERIIAEPGCAGEQNLHRICGEMEEYMAEFLLKYQDMEPRQIADQRYRRFRNM